MITADESRRVRRFVARVGPRQASADLGVSMEVVDAAREQGRMLRSTRDRLIAALDVAEAAA